jgi:hypothetical protein
LPATPPLRRHRTANPIGCHGFFGGGEAFTGIALGAAAFLGFFFSLVRELLPLPMVVTSVWGGSAYHGRHILTHGGAGEEEQNAADC